MRKSLTCLLTLALASVVQTGCGDAAGQRTAYDEALDKVAAAGRGFTAAEGEELAAYRQSALATAGEALDSVIASGSPAQRVGAYRLRAEVNSSSARYAARQAATEYAQLAPQAIQRTSHVLAADRAASRAADRGGDQTPLLDSLKKTLAEQQQKSTQLAADAERLRGELTKLQAEQAEIQSRRDAAATRVGQLRNQAFVASGEEQFRLQDDAAAADREGTLAAAELARKQLEIDMVNSRLAVVQSQTQHTTKLVSDLQKRLEQTQARQAEIQQGVASAEQAQQEELKQLADSYSQIIASFESGVDTRLNDASAQTARAVQLLKDAAAVAKGADLNAVNGDLLGALTTRTEILVEHLQTLASFQDILELVGEGAGQQGAAIQQQISRIQQKRAEVAGLATAAIEEGRTVAQQAMAGSGLDIAQQRAQRLEAYAQQVQQLQGAAK